MDFKDLIFILEHTVLAPSGDNLQSWRFEPCGDRINLYIVVDLDKPLTIFETGYRASYLSAGAAIENMRVAAAHLGYAIGVDYLPNSGNIFHVASISFSPSPNHGHEHFQALRQRATNRRLTYQFWKSISDHTLAQLEQKINSSGDAKLIWICKRDKKFQALCKLVAIANHLHMRNLDLMIEMSEILRFTPEEVQSTRDGLNVKALELDPVGNALLPLIKSSQWRHIARDWGLFSHVAAFHAWLQVSTSQAAGFLVTESDTALDYIRGGEAFERIWHELTSLGIALQPMAALPYFILHEQMAGKKKFTARESELIDDLKRRFFSLFGLKDGSGLIMLFRTGYADPPSVRSLRKPISIFLLSSSQECLRSG